MAAEKNNLTDQLPDVTERAHADASQPVFSTTGMPDPFKPHVVTNANVQANATIKGVKTDDDHQVK